MANLKKFLDQQGVSTLWTKIVAEVEEQVAAEATARNNAIETAVQNETTRAVLAEEAIASDLTNLEKYVGTIPNTYTETDVISYVNKKAEETLSAAQGGSSETAASVKQQLDNYKAENDTKVNANTSALTTLNGDASTEGSVAKTVADAVAAEATARDTAISEAIDGLEPRVKANEDNIATLVGDDANKSVRAIANEELAKQLIAEGAQESLDTLAEIAAWIQSHPDDAAAMNEAIEALEAKVDTGDKTVSAYVTDAIAALSIGDYAKAADLTALAARVEAIEKDYLKATDKTELANAIALKADQSAVDSALALKANQTDLEAEVTARQNAVEANADAIAAIKDDANIDSFADVVAELAKKQNVIPAETYDAYGSAAQALVDTKAYTDAEINTKVIALTTAEIEAAIASATV